MSMLGMVDRPARPARLGGSLQLESVEMRQLIAARLQNLGDAVGRVPTDSLLDGLERIVTLVSYLALIEKKPG